MAEIPELQNIRAILGSKYGKQFVQEACSDDKCAKWHVNEKLRSTVSVRNFFKSCASQTCMAQQ